MFTLNPFTGSIDAVAEPEEIKLISKLEIAERGMLNNFSPLPLKNEPDAKKILPLNIEPLAIDFTTNPSASVTDAVTLPLAIKFEINASGASAVLGILNNLSPLPLNDEPEVSDILPLTIKEPVN